MNPIELIVNENLVYIIYGLVGIVVLLLVMQWVNYCKIRKMQKRYEIFMSKEDVNLEDLLVQYTKKLSVLLQNEQEMQQSIEEMEKQVKKCIQKVGVVRYQAIQNSGADLSYTIALMDKQNDGVVLNGIYGRDGCYTYAKPLVDGKSKYNLSGEEEEAIQKALK